MRLMYCWRCRMELPMLDEGEWARVAPLLSISNVKRIQAAKGCDLKEARRLWEEQACAVYTEITGVKETNINAVAHHRIALYGPECPECHRPLRTPTSAVCLYCRQAQEPRK